MATGGEDYESSGGGSRLAASTPVSIRGVDPFGGNWETGGAVPF